MEISLVYAITHQPPWLNLTVPDDCTLQQAVELSGLADIYPDLDIESQRVGVFGKLATPSTKLKDGDRVEIYRPITRSLDDDDEDD